MNNKGVSAVIGVILMVAITVAIACTVYIYVANKLSFTPEEIIISGNITDKFKIGSCNCQELDYYFELDNIQDIQVNETIYYSYNIGDYYEQVT